MRAKHLWLYPFAALALAGCLSYAETLQRQAEDDLRMDCEAAGGRFTLDSSEVIDTGPFTGRVNVKGTCTNPATGAAIPNI